MACLLVCEEKKWIFKAYCHGNVTTGVLEQSIKTFNNWMFLSVSCLMGKIIFRVTHLKGPRSDNPYFQICTHTHSRHRIQTLVCGVYLQNDGATHIQHLELEPDVMNVIIASQRTWSFQMATLMLRSFSCRREKRKSWPQITSSDFPVWEVSASSAGPYLW